MNRPKLSYIPAVLVLVGIGFAQAAWAKERPSAVPCYREALERALWKDPKSRKVFDTLDEPAPPELLEELRPRWTRIEERAKKVNWEDIVEKAKKGDVNS